MVLLFPLLGIQKPKIEYVKKKDIFNFLAF